MFKIGMQVICLKEGLWTNQKNSIHLDLNYPKNGDILTIRSIMGGKNFKTIK